MADIKYYDVILKPVISEKSMNMMADKKYTFKVHPDANKTEVKRAVEEIFGVKVQKVNTLSVRGRKRRQGYTMGFTPAWKKAVVTLKKGESILSDTNEAFIFSVNLEKNGLSGIHPFLDNRKKFFRLPYFGELEHFLYDFCDCYEGDIVRK